MNIQTQTYSYNPTRIFRKPHKIYAGNWLLRSGDCKTSNFGKRQTYISANGCFCQATLTPYISCHTLQGHPYILTWWSCFLNAFSTQSSRVVFYLVLHILHLECHRAHVSGGNSNTIYVYIFSGPEMSKLCLCLQTINAKVNIVCTLVLVAVRLQSHNDINEKNFMYCAITRSTLIGAGNGRLLFKLFT